MGFLAVPDLEQAAKALGLISIFAALSSIIVGVYFVWRHNRPPPSKNTVRLLPYAMILLKYSLSYRWHTFTTHEIIH